MARSVKRLLITGAQGFVGRHLAARMLASDQNVEVVGIGRSAVHDAFTHRVHWGQRTVLAPLPAYLHATFTSDRYRYATVDLQDRAGLAAVVDDFEPDVVVHMASGLSGGNPADLIRTNVKGTAALLEVLGQRAPQLSVFVLGSTGGVYGSIRDAQLPANEDAPCDPLDSYSVSKLAAERVAEALGQRFAIPVVHARIFNIVGPGQQEQHVCAAVAAQCASIMEGELPPRLVVRDLDTTRDVVDVRDVARALECLVRYAPSAGVYNVASGREVRIRDIVQALLKLTGMPSSIELEIASSGTPAVGRHYAATGRVERLGFVARHPLRESLSDLLGYYRREVRQAVTLHRSCQDE